MDDEDNEKVGGDEKGQERRASRGGWELAVIFHERYGAGFCSVAV